MGQRSFRAWRSGLVHSPEPKPVDHTNAKAEAMTQKKKFVAPKLQEEAPLTTLTQVLVSGGGRECTGNCEQQ